MYLNTRYTGPSVESRAIAIARRCRFAIPTSQAHRQRPRIMVARRQRRFYRSEFALTASPSARSMYALRQPQGFDHLARLVLSHDHGEAARPSSSDHRSARSARVFGASRDDSRYRLHEGQRQQLARPCPWPTTSVSPAAAHSSRKLVKAGIEEVAADQPRGRAQQGARKRCASSGGRIGG